MDMKKRITLELRNRNPAEVSRSVFDVARQVRPGSGCPLSGVQLTVTTGCGASFSSGRPNSSGFIVLIPAGPA